MHDATQRTGVPPAEVFGAKDRWTIVAALQGVLEHEPEEWRLYKEEIGIK